MKYELSLKEFSPSKTFNKLFTRYLLKLTRKLHNFSDDIPKLTVILKRHEKNHFFSGRFSLILPIEPLNAVSGGNTAEEVLTEGFEKIFKEYESYKGKRFKGSSKYPHHETIRPSD
jgi:hypothetical protein